MSEQDQLYPINSKGIERTRNQKIGKIKSRLCAKTKRGSAT